MSNLRARVQEGRRVVDASITLLEGTVLDLVVDDGGDNLTDEERAAPHAALERSAQEAKLGKAHSPTRRALAMEGVSR